MVALNCTQLVRWAGVFSCSEKCTNQHTNNISQEELR